MLSQSGRPTCLAHSRCSISLWGKEGWGREGQVGKDSMAEIPRLWRLSFPFPCLPAHSSNNTQYLSQNFSSGGEGHEYRYVDWGAPVQRELSWVRHSHTEPCSSSYQLCDNRQDTSFLHASLSSLKKQALFIYWNILFVHKRPIPKPLFLCLPQL